jgi:hypothetical protein
MRFSNLLVVLGTAALAGAATAVGCGGDDDGSGSSSNPSGTGGGGSDCALTNPICTSVASDCVALHDNKAAAKFGLRMAQLTIEQPAVLATGTVAKTVAEGLRMNLPQCYLNGTGDFSWLLEFDTAAGTLRTGGAFPTTDPLKGYCFADMAVGTFQIEPTVVPTTLMDGAFTAEVDTLVVPIFRDVGDPITLPLQKVRLFDSRVSADNNCIGKHNPDIDPNNFCLPSDEHPAFLDGGKLSAYLTLEEADEVVVPELDKSLCLLLAGTDNQYASGGSPNKCKRNDADGKILLKGDWCIATNSAATADCADAFVLSASYTASAVEITESCAP